MKLGERMKKYEACWDLTLPRRLPVIIRVDGKGFHTWTRGLQRPFDENFMAAMDCCAVDLCKEICGAVLAYVQSDEISVVVENDQTLRTEPWFDNRVEKLASVSAATASSTMTVESLALFGRVKKTQFASVVSVLPSVEEVVNYLIWRQQDASRNSIQSLARAHYSNKALHGKKTAELHELLYARGQNWNDLPVRQKRGRCVIKQRVTLADGVTQRSVWAIDNNIPVFSAPSLTGGSAGLEYVRALLYPKQLKVEITPE